MARKDKEKDKAYFKAYYKAHKMQNAYSQRLNYWRKKAINLGEDTKTVMELSLGDLQNLCAEHLN